MVFAGSTLWPRVHKVLYATAPSVREMRGTVGLCVAQPRPNAALFKLGPMRTHHFLALTLATLLPLSAPARAAEPLASSASLPAGARSLTFTEAELNQAAAQHFPMQRSVQGLLQITLSRPQVRLQPASNRLRTSVTLQVNEPFTGRAYDGVVSVNHGLRYEASDRSLRMTAVQVDRVDFPSVPEPYRRLLADSAPQVVAQALTEMPLYTAKPEQTAVLEGMGFAIGELQVTPAGLRIVLMPALLAPPVDPRP